MTSAPLLTAALPGFRAWLLDDAGRLLPATGGPAWTPQVNTAVCARGMAHDAPARGCSCGIHAFHTLHRQLAGERVVGAIGAWGEVDVHRDGFRAQHARVLALAFGPPPSAQLGGRLARAAERYGVPLVHRSALQPLVALQTAPVPAALVDLPAGRRAPWLARRRGYDADRQTWVEPSAALVTAGISPALRRWLGEPVAVDVAEGATLAAGTPLRLVGRSAQLALATGVAGRVRAVNRNPAPDAGDPEGAAWLVRVAPADWARDCEAFDWGPAGQAAMLAAGRHEGAFERLRRAPAPDHERVASWDDVRELLQAERRRAHAPRHASARELYDELAIDLGRALALDPEGRRRLEGLGAALAFETREPRAVVGLDLRGPATVSCGRPPASPDVVLRLTANDLEALLHGRIDLARETRTGRVDVAGPRGPALAAVGAVVGWTSRRLPPADHRR